LGEEGQAVPLVSKGSVPEQVKEETDEEPANRYSAEKRLLTRWWSFFQARRPSHHPVSRALNKNKHGHKKTCKTANDMNTLFNT